MDSFAAKDVFDAGKAGDALALEILDEFYQLMGEFLGSLCSVVDPEIVVLGGGVSKAGDFLLDAVRARVPKYLLFKTLPYSRIELARLGADAGMIGAAMLGKHA